MDKDLDLVQERESSYSGVDCRQTSESGSLAFMASAAGRDRDVSRAGAGYGNEDENWDLELG